MGIEVARQINKTTAKTGIIIRSVLGTEHYVLEALRTGTQRYVLKKAPSSELIQAVREVAGILMPEPPV